MAYMSQDHKKELAPGIKAVLKKYGMKGSIGVRHHMSLVVTLRGGDLDFSEYVNDWDWRYIDVNTYWYHEHFADKKIVAFFDELIEAMQGPHWFNEDDIMTDYFHRSHYVDIRIDVCGFKKQYDMAA